MKKKYQVTLMSRAVVIGSFLVLADSSKEATIRAMDIGKRTNQWEVVGTYRRPTLVGFEEIRTLAFGNPK